MRKNTFAYNIHRRFLLTGTGLSLLGLGLAAPAAHAVPVPPAPPGTYYCDFERPDNSFGSAEVKVEFTRQTPGNGWIGRLTNRYKNGGVLVQDMQMFNSRPEATGTLWKFQTTNGQIRCDVAVLFGSHELRFGNCSNGVTQYCVSDQVVRYAQSQQPACPECAGLTGLSLVQCTASCVGRRVGDAGGEAMSAIDCSKHPVRCLVMRFLTWLALREPNNNLRTLLGLEEMYQNWVHFVNGAHGFGNGESCIGQGYLCPGGTMCLGDRCGVAF